MQWRVISMGDGPGRGDGLEDLEVGVATRTRPKTKKPSNYKVLMLNDDYTPMEFETKVSQVIDFARENQHPLQCTLEKA